jgi:hypothetical protein
MKTDRRSREVSTEERRPSGSIITGRGVPDSAASPGEESRKREGPHPVPPRSSKRERPWGLAAVFVIFAAFCAFVFFVVIIVQSLTAVADDAGGEAVADLSGDAAEVASGDAAAVASGDAAAGASDNTAASGESLHGAVPWGAGSINGWVTDRAGSAAVGATVSFVPLDGVRGYFNHAVPSVRTNAAGLFEAVLPCPGAYRIIAGQGRGTAWRDRVSPGASVDLVLQKPSRLTIRVENLDPATPAVVRLLTDYPVPGRVVAGTRQGKEIVFPEMPPGIGIVSIRTGGSCLEVPVESAGGAPVDLELTLPPLEELLGAVKDNFGMPVAGARVTAENGGSAVVTGGDGIFRLDIPAGRRRIEVKAEGFALAVLSMAEPGTFQEVALAREVVWTGSVVDESGAPIGDAAVVVEFTIPHLAEVRTRTIALSAAGGFEWVSPGGRRERFHLSAPGFGSRCVSRSLPAAGAIDPLMAQLKPFVLRRETLLVGGVVQMTEDLPLPGARVTLAPESLLPGSLFYEEASVVADDLGLFRFSPAARGPFRLFVDAGGFGRRSTFFHLSDDLLETLSVEPGRDVAGLVTGCGGLPLAGVALRIDAGEREFRVFTSDAGRFLFRDMAPGAAVVHVRGGGEHVVGDGEELALVLDEGGTFRGSVVDEQGRSLRYFRAAAILPREDAGDAQPLWFTADEEGCFQMPLPAKPARILFRKPGYRDLLLSGSVLRVDGQTYTTGSGRPIVLARG